MIASEGAEPRRAERRTSHPWVLGGALWLAGLAIALLCAGVLSFYAASAPDGLEWVAGQLGFAHIAAGQAVGWSPLPDYQFAGIADARLSGGLAGVVGTLLVLALSMGLMWVLRRRPAKGR